ncbi:MAG TPA: hypothetical protein VD866_23670, partial [Urbifossiella sp.]|nr:hypothetical protein [Urbifossiella sp.]
MTVRRRLLASSLGFVAALALITSAQAQPPRGTQDPTTDEIKQRLEAFANRKRVGGGEAQPFPNGIPPGLEKWVENIARQRGIKPGPDGKLNPEQLKQLGEQLKNDPRFKGMKQNGGQPPVEPNPGKVTQPGPRVDGKGNPLDFKDGGPFKNPPDKGAPRPVPPPPPPMPMAPDKDVQRPDAQKRPDPARPDQPRGPKDKGVELPWEKPESPQDKARQAAAAVWEKSVGPLDETPAVKKALFDIVEGTGDLKDPDGNSLWDSLS